MDAVGVNGKALKRVNGCGLLSWSEWKIVRYFVFFQKLGVRIETKPRRFIMRPDTDPRLQNR
jgi:hypothetical protein